MVPSPRQPLSAGVFLGLLIRGLALPGKRFAGHQTLRYLRGETALTEYRLVERRRTRHSRSTSHSLDLKGSAQTLLRRVITTMRDEDLFRGEVLSPEGLCRAWERRIGVWEVSVWRGRGGKVKVEPLSFAIPLDDRELARGAALMLACGALSVGAVGAQVGSTAGELQSFLLATPPTLLAEWRSSAGTVSLNALAKTSGMDRKHLRRALTSRTGPLELRTMKSLVNALTRDSALRRERLRQLRWAQAFTLIERYVGSIETPTMAMEGRQFLAAVAVAALSADPADLPSLAADGLSVKRDMLPQALLAVGEPTLDVWRMVRDVMRFKIDPPHWARAFA